MNDKPDDNMMENLEKLVDNYIKHRKSIEKVMEKIRMTEDKMEIKDLCAEYEYHKGYCKAVEQWMHALGLNPYNDYISERLNEDDKDE